MGSGLEDPHVKIQRLAAATIIAGFAAVFALAPASAQKPRKDMKIGLQLYTVRDDCAKDLPGVLKAVSKMGYSGVEFAGYYGRSAQELRAMLDEDHLKCYGTHIGLDTLMGENLVKTVEFNKVLGNTMLIVPWIPEERRSSKERIIETAKLFTDIAAKLKPYGMTLGYHNHMDEFKPVDGEEPYYTFFDHAGKDVVVQFDIGNAMEGGAQAAPYIRRYPGRVRSVHVKDSSKTNKQALLGEGDVKWDEVLPLILGPAGTKYFIIEQESYAYPPLVCAEKCLRNFEKMLAARSASR
jgi:sugar phosphate isomerase/epimerase